MELVIDAPESYEEELNALRKKLLGEEEHGRMRFAVKLINLLRFQKKHPKSIYQIGIGWCPDGKSFISNSKILGNYLNIRANSVNTNFRINMFQIVDCAVNEFVSTFGNIPDISSWNKRIHPSFPWSVNTTPDDAAKIKPMSSQKSGLVLVQTSLPPNSPLPKQVFSSTGIKRVELKLVKIDPNAQQKGHLDFMPEATLALLSNDTDQLLSVPKLLRGMNLNDKERQYFVQAVTDKWKDEFGPVLSVPHQNVVDSLMLKCDSLHPLYNQIYTNIEYFLCNSQCQSQISNEVKFDEYLALMAKYGPHDEVFDNIVALTEPDSHSILDELSFGSNSQSDSKPSFKPWFHPMLDAVVTESFLKSQTSECWVVRHSKSTNAFSVHAKICYDGKFIITSTHVWYKTFPSNSTERYSVKMSEGVIKYAASLEEMLFNVMDLKAEDSLRLNISSTKPETKRVDACVLAERTPIPQLFFDSAFEFI